MNPVFKKKFDSFIFSFDNENIENYILSRVKDEKKAIRNIDGYSKGPSFGIYELSLWQSINNKLRISCENTIYPTYEKRISKIDNSNYLELELFKIDI
ncbi:hypothetical protein RhiirA5_408806 [Rhizophagus irregularis]|uniref:Uncharacterized protein n=1 Tax=Rhizophagus irregularis TaxID=588596 RepID=A0A2N0Q788_9GLOM|nr:hypothetical protein RhiirA5_408806 [Rhizophagus irregularis]PKC59514.1 hypothetical protein RhiirA1_469322 [Rhizophagus irregularis]